MILDFLKTLQHYLWFWDGLYFPIILILGYLVGIPCAIHALFNKQDPRASLAWTAICLLVPGFGAIYYIVFGVNRIKSRAMIWRSSGRWQEERLLSPKSEPINIESLNLPFNHHTFLPLIKISASISKLPLIPDCSIEALFNGEECYPKMLEAIEAAQDWIYLSTYIFEPNQTGHKFVKALARAQERGVEVKVLVDGYGAFHAKGSIKNLLKKAKIPCAFFLPPSLFNIHINLRTHRKVMVVDGKLGFTGGMNIGDRHLTHDPKNKKPVQDIHFLVKGKILAQLQESFLTDWYFCTKKIPERDFHYETAPASQCLCRGIIDGPNEELEKIRLIMNGALSCAREKVWIMTPYFIPDPSLTSSLITAANRGVDVIIILPEINNLPYVKWASHNYLAGLIKYGIKIYFQPPPFAHTKYFLVDDFYSLLGSANVDPRSLRLNFEFNLEVYDLKLNQQLSEHFVNTKETSQLITEKFLENRPAMHKLRDALAKLFSPYL